MTRAHYLRIGATLGYGAKETMLLCPGVLFDMFELHVHANRPAGGGEEVD